MLKQILLDSTWRSVQSKVGNGAIKDAFLPLLYYPAINQINLRLRVDNTISSLSAWRKKKEKKKKGQTLTRHGEKIRRPSRIDGRKDFHIRRYRLRNVAHYLRQKRNFSRWKSSQNNKKGTITQAFLYSDRDEAEGSVEKVFTCIHLNSSRCTWKHHKQKQIFHIAVDAKSKYNLLVFSTFAEKATTRQNQDYRSNVLYANALRNFYPCQRN